MERVLSFSYCNDFMMLTVVRYVTNLLVQECKIKRERGSDI